MSGLSRQKNGKPSPGQQELLPIGTAGSELKLTAPTALSGAGLAAGHPASASTRSQGGSATRVAQEADDMSDAPASDDDADDDVLHPGPGSPDQNGRVAAAAAARSLVGPSAPIAGTGVTSRQQGRQSLNAQVTRPSLSAAPIVTAHAAAISPEEADNPVDFTSLGALFIDEYVLTYDCMRLCPRAWWLIYRISSHAHMRVVCISASCSPTARLA